MTRGITEQFFDMMLEAQKREAEYRQSRQQAAEQNHEAAQSTLPDEPVVAFI